MKVSIQDSRPWEYTVLALTYVSSTKRPACCLDGICVITQKHGMENRNPRIASATGASSNLRYEKQLRTCNADYVRLSLTGCTRRQPR